MRSSNLWLFLLGLVSLSAKALPCKEELERLAAEERFATLQHLEKISTQTTHPSVITLDSGLQVQGHLKQVRSVEIPKSGAGAHLPGEKREIAYLQFDGPTQLQENGRVLPGQSVAQHPSGFGSPVGALANAKDLVKLNDQGLAGIGVSLNKHVTLHYKSGVVVDGVVSGWTRSAQGDLMIMTFKNCSVKMGDTVLFDPAWGDFDMAVGQHVTGIGLP